jgi:dTMP kinase
MKPEAELLLFAASRAQLVREVIEPALAAGVVVLADRFLDSTTVYQGVARKLAATDVQAINRFAVGACRPDVTFVFDLDQETARHRMLRRPRPVGEMEDRMESQPPEFYEAVRAGYLKLADEEPERVKVIDTRAPVGDVESAIWTILEEKFHGIFAGSRV